MKSTAFKILKSRKGISPILATLLLIVIAVAAISITYAWVMTYMGNTTNNAGVSLFKANVEFDGSTVIVDIGNSGTADAVVTAVYAGNSTTSMTKVLSPTTSAGTIGAGGEPVSFTLSSMNFTTRAYFRVVPSSGSPLEFDVAAP